VLLRSRIGATQLPLRYGGSRPDVTVRQPVQESSPLPSSSSSSSLSSSSSSSSSLSAAAAAASDDQEVTSVRSVSEVMDPIAVAAALKEEIKELKELEAKVKQDPLDHEVLEMLDPDKQAMNYLIMPEEAIEGNFITQPSSEGRSDIAPKGNLVVELEVDKLHGSSVAVSWTFKLHTYLATMDIGFSVIFQPKDKSAKVSSSKLSYHIESVMDQILYVLF
jgi:hypothetical protein